MFTPRSRSAAVTTALRYRSANSVVRIARVSGAPAAPCLPVFRKTPSSVTASSYDLTSIRPFSTSPGALKMASDDDYMAFLNKANEDPAAGVRNASSSASPSQGGDVKTKTIDEGEQVPASIKDIEAYYVSDTDAEFVPVTLKFDPAREGKWPDSSKSHESFAYEIVCN